MRRVNSIESLCILTICFALATVARAQAQVRGASDYLDGLSALSNGNVSDAVTAFNKAVSADDENSAYHTAKGIALYLSDQFNPAADEFERSQKLGNTQATDLWGWANSMMINEPPPDNLDPAVRARMYQQRRRTNYDTRPPYESREPYARPFIESATAYTGAYTRNTPQKNQVKKALVQFGSTYAWNQMSGPALAPVLMGKVKTLYDQQKYADCLALIDHIRANNANDPNLLFYSAGCKADAGDNEAARAEYTQVLKAWPQYAPAFLGRAKAAAKMGAIDRANRDLASAASIDPKATSSVKAEIAKELADAAAKLPKEPQPVLLDALKKAVTDNEPMPALVNKAEPLERAAAAARFIVAEGYTEERQRLESLAAADPKNADKQVALATFLIQPTMQRPVRIPGKTGMTRVSVGNADVPNALTAINAALAINPKHIGALTQGALAAVQSDQADNAIQWVQRAFDDGGTNLDLCTTWLDYYTAQAGALAAQAANLRAPKTHTEFHGDVSFLVTVYPSQAELAQAAELDRQSDDLRRKAAGPIQAFVELRKGTIDGYLASAEFEKWRGKWDDSIAAANEVLKMDPWNLDAHEFLVDLGPKIQMMDLAIEHQNILNNLVNASAGRTLDKVWKLLADTKYRSARDTIAEAEKIDPASSRVPAYLAAVATAEKKPDEVISAGKQSLAMELARERVNGRSLDMAAQSQLSPDDAGLFMSTGIVYGGGLSAQSKFDGAIDIYRHIVVLGKRLPSNLWDTPMQSSALPSAENQQNNGWTPRQLMTDASHQAAIVFMAAGRPEDAAKALMAWIQINGKGDLPQGAMDYGYGIYQKLGPQKSAQYFTQNMMGYYQMKDGQAQNQQLLNRANQIQADYEKKFEDIQRRRIEVVQKMQQMQNGPANPQGWRDLQNQQAELDREYQQLMIQRNQQQMQNMNPNNQPQQQPYQQQRGYSPQNSQQQNYPQQNYQQPPPQQPGEQEFAR